MLNRANKKKAEICVLCFLDFFFLLKADFFALLCNEIITDKSMPKFKIY